MAGRSQEKLERLRSQLADINPACAGVPIITADLTDSKSLDKLVKQSDVIISVAGPFWKLGLPLVCLSCFPTTVQSGACSHVSCGAAKTCQNLKSGSSALSQEYAAVAR